MLFQASLPCLTQCRLPGSLSQRLPARPSSGVTSSEKPSLIFLPSVAPTPALLKVIINSIAVLSEAVSLPRPHYLQGQSQVLLPLAPQGLARGWTPTSVTNEQARVTPHIAFDSIPFSFLFPGRGGGCGARSCVLAQQLLHRWAVAQVPAGGGHRGTVCMRSQSPLPPSGPQRALVTLVSHRSSDDVCHQAGRELQPSITSCPGNTSRVIGQTHAQGVSCPSHQGPPRGQ